MMNDAMRTIGFIIGIVLTLTMLIGIAIAVKPFGVAIVLGAAATLYGIALLGFLDYREARQEELRNVLTLAVESKSPLADAVWAYVEERPRGWFREASEFVFTNMVAIGSFWMWHRRRRFDRKIANLAVDLESGMRLSQALWRTPGAASRETMLAVAVGESTGNLALPLRHVSETRLGPSIVEILPRLFYPLAVIVFQCLIVCFLTLFIVPKFEKIAFDLKVPLPDFVKEAYGWSRWFAAVAAPFLALLIMSLLWIVPMLFLSPEFRWRLLGVSSIERRVGQGRMLKMLGMLLNAGKTIPQALALLREHDYLGRAVQARLLVVQETIEAGQSLSAALIAQGLLPKNMAPLLQAAERARNLPWALEEAGETLVRRARTLLQRVSAIVGPVTIAILGLITAAVALAIFLPLVTILTKLTPP